MKSLVLGITLVVFAGCAKPADPYLMPNEITEGITENNVPGTVNHTWAEPMHDTVRVPGQLDPTGTYYRPSHNTVVEIRPERYQEVQYPADRKRLQKTGSGN